MRTLPLATLALLLACASAATVAQTEGKNTSQPAPVLREPLSKSEQLEGPENQRIERIRIEDNATRIDELRYGGQTQRIAVQPKSGLPEYQVQPGGTRVWNLLNF